MERGGCFCVGDEIVAIEREDAVGRDGDPGVYLVGWAFDGAQGVESFDCEELRVFQPSR